MAKKGYLVSAYRSIKDPDKLAAYAKLAGPAFAKYGARYLARDTAAQAYEAGIKQRIVIVEFESVAKAVEAHDSPEYQAALKAFGRLRRARSPHRRGAGVALPRPHRPRNTPSLKNIRNGVEPCPCR